MVVYEPRIDVMTKDAQVLARWMKRRKISVRELAFKVSTRRQPWSHGTIGEIRAGNKRTVNTDLADRIAEVLDVPWDDLFMERSSTVYRETARKVSA